MGGKSSQPTSTTTKTAPWEVQQPYLEDIYKRAKSLYGHEKPIYETRTKYVPWVSSTGEKIKFRNTDALNRVAGQDNLVSVDVPLTGSQRLMPVTEQVQVGTEFVPGEGKLSYFPDATVAGFTPEQIEAQNLILNRAREGSPLVAASQGYLEDVISGKYLQDNNPYLDYYVNRAYENALPQWRTTATQAGRYGSDAWARGQAQTMADLASQIYGGAYGAERGLQQQAASIAPDVAREDYFDLSQMAKVGAEKQAMEQALIDAAREKWEFEQLAPWKELAMMANLISGDVGGTAISTYA